jgi:GNAT superfamily N-acetyltransferase
MTTTLRITQAESTPENLQTLLGLIQEAAAWLRCYKETDQWAKPWPDEEQRDARVRSGLEAGKTWIVWDGEMPAATITTATRANPAVWSGPGCLCDLSESSVFVHRLITARNYSGWGLGAELINWAGLQAHREYAARWVRIDVWTTNEALHNYYQKRGFAPCGCCPDPDYPSGALFQKPVSEAMTSRIPLIRSGSAYFQMADVPEVAFTP